MRADIIEVAKKKKKKTHNAIFFSISPQFYVTNLKNIDPITSALRNFNISTV